MSKLANKVALVTGGSRCNRGDLLSGCSQSMQEFM